MPASRCVTTTDPTYGPPVVREPSPVDSINTVYGDDVTPQALTNMTEEELARTIETQMGLRRTGWDSTARPVLLPKPKTPEEERMLFASVMDNLRKQVKALEDEETFQATTLRNLNPAFDEQPSSSDIDSIMQNLMGTRISGTNPSQKRAGPPGRVNGDNDTTSTMGQRTNINSALGRL